MGAVPAILLLGPTASGKTPLGRLMERGGVAGRRCRHFDFGGEMRRIVAGDEDAGLTAAEIAFLDRVLAAGALLDDEHFPVAEQVLRAFLVREGVGGEDVVALNGLPRHVGQAEAVDAIVDVVAVVHLRCSTEVILERLRTDVGGDRAGRLDDDLESVRHKLVLFFERTAPLLSRYRNAGIPIETIDVAATDTPEQVWATLDRRRPI